MKAEYFDGRSSRPHLVELMIERGVLVLVGEDLAAGVLRYPLKNIHWSEPTQRGARMADLGSAGQVHALDAGAWDDWVRQNVGAHPWVVRVQRSWRGVAVALVALLLAVGLVYAWGLPRLARAVVPFIPASVDRALGEGVMAQFEGRILRPSELPQEAQERIRSRFAQIVGAGSEGLQLTQGRLQLEFRAAPQLGPNAFALPGGMMVLTDELVKRMDNEDIIMGVLAHEWGHVRHRHGMRQLVQVSALQAGLSVAMGDYGSFLTTAPLIVASMGYSREHEREADVESVRLLRGAGISPEVMAQFFEKVRGRSDPTRSPRERVGIAIWASHPDDAERIAFFRQAAQGQ